MLCPHRCSTSRFRFLSFCPLFCSPQRGSTWESFWSRAANLKSKDTPREQDTAAFSPLLRGLIAAGLQQARGNFASFCLTRKWKGRYTDLLLAASCSSAVLLRPQLCSCSCGWAGSLCHTLNPASAQPVHCSDDASFSLCSASTRTCLCPPQGLPHFLFLFLLRAPIEMEQKRKRDVLYK